MLITICFSFNIALMFELALVLISSLLEACAGWASNPLQVREKLQRFLSLLMENNANVSMKSFVLPNNLKFSDHLYIIV